ncbi:TolC family protein [Pelobacter propionicus]|uniref:Outer membrane efflux protein n=1 Tax=Pelobacter propionicus (strain DSM 2379 / NBRC 103807 / OttBd1) TaxID=338966 RepID=A0R7Z0_PELPD|nr:TolC family protein [Pelobacter propionicus]ABL01301.1 outer membrane efflux protein [Pelobacter propionicus DSM 2379]
MKVYLLLLLTILFLPHALYAANILTLDDALETALKNHPQLMEAREYLHGAEARTLQAKASYYPQVSIAADWNKGRTFLTPTESIKSTKVHSEAVYLKQTIYDFGRTANAVEAAHEADIAASETVAVTRQDLAFRVRSAYYLLLAAEKQVVAVKETVEAREAVFRQAQEFFSQGIRAKVEVTRAEANLYAARTALIRAENNRDIAWVELSNSIGIPSLNKCILAEPSTAIGAVPDRAFAQNEALNNRAELKRQTALKNSAAASLKAAKSGYLPLLTGTASAGYADRDFPPGGNVWAIGLNLTIPIFSGFSTVAQTKEAVAALRGVEAQHNNLKLQIAKDVETAWFSIREATARISSTEKEVIAARENRSLAMGRYQEGIGNIIEVTDAQSQSLDADTSKIQAIYDYHIAVARLHRAIGKE